MDEQSVVVAGAGLAGLVAARRLAAAGADVTVFERRDDVGGRVRTTREDGFQFDRGFQVLFTAYPAVREELDLDALELRRFAPGAVIARPGERSVLADPLRNPGALLETLFNREVTTSDKVRTLLLRQHVGTLDERDVFAGDDESIRAYLEEWGFSASYVENFVAPFYGGITLDRSLATSKRVFEYTFKMLSAGGTAVPAAGMGAIAAQLADAARDAGAEIRLGEAVESVSTRADGVDVVTAERTRGVDAAVVATDPKTAFELTGVESIPREGRSCVTQYYRLPAEQKLETGKRLVLNAANAEPNAVVPTSAVAPEYAPDDAHLLGATFLGRRALETPAETLAATTRDALASWFPERRFDALERLHTDRIPFAQFAQPPGCHDDLPGARAAGGDVYLAGDYTQWSSIQGALKSGRVAAEAVLAD